jgi:hypothetical protein
VDPELLAGCANAVADGGDLVEAVGYHRLLNVGSGYPLRGLEDGGDINRGVLAWRGAVVDGVRADQGRRQG